MLLGFGGVMSLLQSFDIFLEHRILLGDSCCMGLVGGLSFQTSLTS